MHQSEIAGLVKALAPIVSDFVAKAIAPLGLRLKALEEREPVKGEKGDPGQEGTPGVPGRDGIDGKDGAPGLDGKDGAPGERGADGAAGRDGVDGNDGAPGADGKDGPTLDELRPLIAELVAAYVEALPKQPVSFMIDEAGNLVGVYAGGETKQIGLVRGKDGLRGASIMDGSIDEDGLLHLRMSDGRNVQVGKVRGEPGKAGESIEGRPGRDALEIQILPGVDESRSYPEGVCARWRGGVIRSDRQTTPIIDGDIAAAGWSVLLEGIAEESEQISDDGRNVERTTVYTGGRSFVRKIKTASVLDRGVWREGSFEKGDGVTYAGSFFIAQRDTISSDKPGQSDAWRLAVKRGRDGQDGKLRDQTPKPVKL